MIYKEQFKIGLKDIGKNNELTNKAILEFLENIADHHSDYVGYGANTTKKTQRTWLLLDWQLEVIKRPRYGQILDINTWSRYTNKCYSYRDFEVYDENGTLCAIATSKWIFIDISKNKITKVEENVISKYEPEEEKSVFKILELPKVKEPIEYISTVEYKIRRADIDINNHLHNLNYLDLAYEALPEEVYEKSIFNNVRISYKKEIKGGAEVRCKYSCVEGKHIVTIYNDDEKILHAIIILYF